MKLSEGTTLQGGKYRIEKSLGQGGFGITYLAEDTRLRRQVVIKEFFIGELCFRENETSQVTVLSEGGRKKVDHFRKKFFREAQLESSPHHHPLCRIRREQYGLLRHGISPQRVVARQAERAERSDGGSRCVALHSSGG